MRVTLPLVLTLLHLGLATSTSTAYSLDDSEPNPPFPRAKDGIQKNFVSATLGSNMVLQRDVEAILWGYTQPGATVTTTFHRGDGLETIVLTTTAHDEDGLWRQPLPPQPAKMTPGAVTIKSTTGQTQVLDNLLFGDVYLCGGQS
jgi:sialate O-acetylesterase